MKIMIFLEGTALKTSFPLFLFSVHGNKPIKNAVNIINGLYEGGNEIVLCSYLHENRRRFIERILKFYGIKYSSVALRSKNESYAQLTERILPDVLIEDDCKSIGGEKNMCITNVKNELKSRITSIVVPEFSGIENVPEIINKLHRKDTN